jgi:hypothetical protein
MRQAMARCFDTFLTVVARLGLGALRVEVETETTELIQEKIRMTLPGRPIIFHQTGVSEELMTSRTEATMARMAMMSQQGSPKKTAKVRMLIFLYDLPASTLNVTDESIRHSDRVQGLGTAFKFF